MSLEGTGRLGVEEVGKCWPVRMLLLQLNVFIFAAH